MSSQEVVVRDIEDLPFMLTVPEFSHHMSLGLSTTWQAVRAGEIKSVRIRRTVRIPRSEVERLLGLHVNGDTAPR